jgi:histidinol dehydrogenase
MNVFKNPLIETWSELIKRPEIELEFLDGVVKNILTRVKKSGDSALFELTRQFDKVEVNELQVSVQEINESEAKLTKELKASIQTAASNIEKFHVAQKLEIIKIETTPGITCWRKGVPISKVGIYIPGGTAPLFSTVLMLGIPAKLAGCEEIILCTPPDHAGKISPAILYTANLIGIKKVFRVGGAQAIAAMAYGTESIPKVYKVFGPGNQFVTKAKQLVNYEGTAIDMPAGPSEVLVMADETANASFVAADLLSQAEHGEDSQVMLVVTEESILSQVKNELEKQLPTLPRKTIAEQTLANSRAVYIDSTQRAIDFVNAYAPEHLIINTKNADAVSEAL